MMGCPERRLWLYQVGHSLEVVALGQNEEIATTVVGVKAALEKWPGFHTVRVIAGGHNMGALSAQMSPLLARYDDPIAEFLAMIDGRGMLSNVEWSTATTRAGMVGTW